jgi:hypothetical protein
VPREDRIVSDDSPSIDVPLSIADLALLCEALDSYEYWQLGDCLPRNNGFVFVPGDAVGNDRYWTGVEPSVDQAQAIDLVLECRALARRLSELAQMARSRPSQ